ncbi:MULTISPECIES: PEP-CTERM sorting domain-containing protein [Cyanophyceae]|uniref:PEP-CTERM sorting domain-containing protein n=1 Tax=Cyanophyceae TaxID=3028117 RepID=UPI00168257B2|nr:PEP-CTERM sorting domain-containing protein [Trichocoleus sp. FACHB-69]MBD1930360.1 PEP-CTERM sorting domain-containing protein [Trichocoleus sp. FACHB-69]
MHNYYLSILLGLTTTVAVGAPLSAQAATFNFDQLQNISSRPIDSEYSLNLLGEPSENQGFTAFFNLDPSAPDFGHTDISLNSRGDGAPYYNTGRQGSPEVPPSGATRTSSVSEIAGFPTLNSFLTNNGISFSSLGFGFGQRSDRDFTATWNLGDDILGQDWFASPDSTIEERIYAANPDDVEIFLTFSTTKIVSFGYSDIYAVLDYGATTSLSDDIDAAFTDPVTATKVAGLDPFADALANALLQDISTAGGAAQIVVEDTAVEEGTFTIGNGFGILNFQFVGSLRAVPSATVPEPTSALGILMLGALGAVSHLKKQKNKRGA